jgi:predicted rRNA methylase YqxC with S4 and FtsJ domains
LAVGSQRFQSVARRNAKVVQRPRLIEQAKFSQCDILNVSWQLSTPPSDQISSAWGSAKLLIMPEYNAVRYSFQHLVTRRIQF